MVLCFWRICEVGGGEAYAEGFVSAGGVVVVGAVGIGGLAPALSLELWSQLA